MRLELARDVAEARLELLGELVALLRLGDRGGAGVGDDRLVRLLELAAEHLELVLDSHDLVEVRLQRVPLDARHARARVRILHLLRGLAQRGRLLEERRAKRLKLLLDRRVGDVQDGRQLSLLGFAHRARRLGARGDLTATISVFKKLTERCRPA